MRTRLRFFARSALLALLAGAGCAAPAARTLDAPPFVPVNHAGVDRLPPEVRRVVLLPASGGGGEALDAILREALQRQNRFEIVALDRADCLRRFRAEEFPSAGLLPPDLLETLRREWAADAVMFVDVTTRRSIRPLTLGLRAKLAAVGDVRLLWTFDTVFSAADPAVAASARRHYFKGEGASEVADRSAAVLQSPSRFAAYAADAAFATLPLR